MVYNSAKRPIAVYDANTDVTRRFWKTLKTLTGVWQRDKADAGDSDPSIYAIHTDHLGTPQVVTDAQQQVVWQADTTPFGLAKITYAAMAADTGTRFELPLRLPGQVYDDETGLHYNYYRDYDPHLGRYTTPDPIGLHGGLNPYAYVSNNPLSNTDSLGLYEEDVHYYMTFFLARMAGIGYQEALTIAMAAQYIDDNPDTWPMDPKNAGDNIGNPTAINRLLRYHFTTTLGDGPLRMDYDQSRSFEELAYHLAFGGELQSYIDRRYKDPINPQLSRLNAAANNALTRCGRAQFFGEYLHAFEDTFSHRDQQNTPINLNGGLGHGAWGHSPDKTYNHVVTTLEVVQRGDIERLAIKEIGNWSQNEARSYEMEFEVFQKLRQFNGTAGKNSITDQAIRFKDLADFLQDWNRIQDTPTKIVELAFKLDDFGLGSLPDYDKHCAAEKRKAYIGGLDQNKFPGTILPKVKGDQAKVSNACN